MSKIAIFGDVHSNIDALETVLADAEAQGVDGYLCTGDIVGYNACPRECLERVLGLDCPVVMGNHDFYVSSARNLSDFNPLAAHVIEWTRRQLAEEDIAKLAALPFTHVSRGISLVHSTMDRPENFGYVFDNLEAQMNFVNQRSPICFHGHTHCPMIYENSMGDVFRIDPQDFKLQPGRKYFINVGSVGQPRDGDPRASYAIYDTVGRTMAFRRLAYDVEKAQERILKAQLPVQLAARLAVGQ